MIIHQMWVAQTKLNQAINTMALIPTLRFIPFRKADIIAMCLADDRLSQEQQTQFKKLADSIEQYFHTEFHGIQEQLKDLYAPHDPDADTRPFRAPSEKVHSPNQPPLAPQIKLVDVLAELLDRANYEIVDRDALQAALDSESMFKIRLHVDLNEFDEVLLYCRGMSEREETVTSFFGLIKKQIRFINYDRVVLYLRFKQPDNNGLSNSDHDTVQTSTESTCSGPIMLKLFQNVPQADIEMLFPNTQVGMRVMDKLLIGIPALISGGIVLTTKLGATLVLLGSLLGYWLGTHEQQVNLDKNALIALGAGLGAVAGYLWKQFSSYKNRKLRFTQALTQNLYFKLLDNNAGVFYRLINDAEEAECKETLLAYYFLFTSPAPLTASALDEVIEQWFEQNWHCRLDFDINDALIKLKTLSLAKEHNGLWQCNQTSM
jgi:hypothetical protein